MINPWELYFVLKLDDICLMFLRATKILGTVSLVAVGGLFAWWLWFKIHEEEETEDYKKCAHAVHKNVKYLLIFSAFFWVVSVLTPTTKQAAAIIMIPKVINSGFVQKDLSGEAKEVYGIFKKWLNNATQTKNEQEKSDTAI